MKIGMAEDKIILNLCNVPRDKQPGKRVIGFCVDQEAIPCMGLFSDELEKYCRLMLETRGYKVTKNKKFDRLTTETYSKTKPETTLTNKGE